MITDLVVTVEFFFHLSVQLVTSKRKELFSDHLDCQLYNKFSVYIPEHCIHSVLQHINFTFFPVVQGLHFDRYFRMYFWFIGRCIWNLFWSNAVR